MLSQQTLDNYLNRFKEILKQVKEEVGKLYSKQKEINKHEKDILSIKECASQILTFLQNKKEQFQKKESKEQFQKKESKEQLQKEKQTHETPKVQKEQNTIQEGTITSLNKPIEIEHKANVWSILELQDSRIATGDYKGYIRLFSIDYTKDKWTKLTEHRAHNECINSLCELNAYKLISSSDDKTLKVWIINNNSISPIKTLKGHNHWVYQIRTLSSKQFASAGSYDKTINIWDANTYKKLHSLDEDFNVYSLLKLKKKDIMVSSGNGNSVSFWNINTFSKEHSVSCCNCNSFHGIIELPHHRIAVSGGGASTIDIIDTEHYKVIKQIECKNYIDNCSNFSSIYLLNNETFIYSHEGNFCQIATSTYEVLFKFQIEDEFRGDAIMGLSNGKYIVANNKKKGISIFKLS